MQIDKSQILDFLREQGDSGRTAEADRELPDKVDTDNGEHQNLLQRFGIDPTALAKQFLGGRGIPGL